MLIHAVIVPALGLTVFEAGAKKPEKRKKVKGGEAADIESFLGPWAKYQDEKDVAKPSEWDVHNLQFMMRWIDLW